LRDQGHDILAARKERRRFSLASMRRFFGDYLAVSTSSQGLGYQVRAACGASSSESVLFSSRCQVLVPRPLRSSKPGPRMIVITTGAVYITMATIERRLLSIRLERKIALSSLRGLSTSTLQDDWVVLHVTPGPGSGATKDENLDVLVSCPFKTELITHLLSQTRGTVTLNVQPQINYTKKGTKTQTVKFVKNEALGPHDTYKSHVAQVGTGEPANSVSRPPCRAVSKPRPAKPRPVRAPKATKAPRPAPATRPLPSSGDSGMPADSGGMASSVADLASTIRARTSMIATAAGSSAPAPPPPPPPPAPPAAPTSPTYKALYDFTAVIDGGLNLTINELYEVIEQHDNGWWLGRSKDGTEGWVPSNYLEKVETAPAPPPPPPPPARSTPTPTPAAKPVTPARREPSIQPKPATPARQEPKPPSKPARPNPTSTATNRPAVPTRPGANASRFTNGNATADGDGSHSSSHTGTSEADDEGPAPAARRNVSQMIAALNSTPGFNPMGQRPGSVAGKTSSDAPRVPAKPSIPPKPASFKPPVPSRPTR
ncbi:class II myosin, partial [Dispira parvispora]